MVLAYKEERPRVCGNMIHLRDHLGNRKKGHISKTVGVPNKIMEVYAVLRNEQLVRCRDDIDNFCGIVRC